MARAARGVVARLLLGGLLLSAPLPAASESLSSALERLRAAGYEVMFSSDVISPDAQVDMKEATPRGLQRALDGLRLSVDRVGSQWLIARVHQPPAHTDVFIRSAHDVPLQSLTASWGGKTVPLGGGGRAPSTVPAPPGILVTIRAERHRPAVVRLSPGQTVVLERAPLVESLIVTGSRHRLSGRTVAGSVTTLDAEALAEVPTLANDALRAVTGLPGMSSVGVSAKPRIRGGVQDELLIRLDGVELLDGYHLADFQNIFSAVDDRAVESVDVYTGGFPARYGNRMSGVIDIDTDTPAGGPRTEVGVSVFSLLANTQGAVDEGRTRYLASIRRGNLDQVTRAVNPDLGRPRYHDALAKVDRDLGADGRLSVGAFVTRDDVVLEEDATQARSDIDSRYLWMRLERDHGASLRSASTVSYTWSDRRKRLADVDDGSQQTGFLDHQQELRSIAMSNDLAWRRDGWLMELGADLEYGRSRYDSVAAVNRGLIGSVLTGIIEDGHDIHLEPDGLSGGAYASADIPLGEEITLQPGIRWDFQNFDPNGPTYHVSPRLGLRWQPRPTLSLHFDVGRFHQPDALHELQAADGESSFYRPQSADHFIAGVEWLTGPWDLSAELYHKRYRDTKRRYENMFNPFVLVPELEPDRIAIEPERARARGADLTVSRHLTEQARLRLHYGYMDAEDRLHGDWVPRRWSQRHTAGAMLSWQGAALSATLAVNWHSGWRGAALPPEVPVGTVLGVDELLNNITLEDYVSVDASIRRTWRFGHSEVTAFATITNLTARENVAGVDYDAEEEDGIIYLQPGTESLIPLVPSIGILISF